MFMYTVSFTVPPRQAQVRNAGIMQAEMEPGEYDAGGYPINRNNARVVARCFADAIAWAEAQRGDRVIQSVQQNHSVHVAPPTELSAG